MSFQRSLYTSVVQVSKTYLGPAGERFIRRQIETHLHIEPHELMREDLAELAVWTRVAFAMLTDDSEHVNAYIDDLMALEKIDSRGSRA